jgi:hypothetical protein
VTTRRSAAGPVAADPSLQALAGHVREARTALGDSRRGRVVRDDLALAYRHLLTTLELYAIGLEKRSLPVPWRLRSEVTLLRGLSRPSSTLADALVYERHQRPDVEVLADGRWCDGELLMWLRRDDGWWASVSWRPRGEQTRRHEIVPAPRVRRAGSTDAAHPAG